MQRSLLIILLINSYNSIMLNGVFFFILLHSFYSVVELVDADVIFVDNSLEVQIGCSYPDLYSAILNSKTSSNLTIIMSSGSSNIVNSLILVENKVLTIEGSSSSLVFQGAGMIVESKSSEFLTFKNIYFIMGEGDTAVEGCLIKLENGGSLILMDILIVEQQSGFPIVFIRNTADTVKLKNVIIKSASLASYSLFDIDGCKVGIVENILIEQINIKVNALGLIFSFKNAELVLMLNINFRNSDGFGQIILLENVLCITIKDMSVYNMNANAQDRSVQYAFLQISGLNSEVSFFNTLFKSNTFPFLQIIAHTEKVFLEKSYFEENINASPFAILSFEALNDKDLQFIFINNIKFLKNDGETLLFVKGMSLTLMDPYFIGNSISEVCETYRASGLLIERLVNLNVLGGHILNNIGFDSPVFAKILSVGLYKEVSIQIDKTFVSNNLMQLEKEMSGMSLFLQLIGSETIITVSIYQITFLNNEVPSKGGNNLIFAQSVTFLLFLTESEFIGNKAERVSSLVNFVGFVFVITNSIFTRNVFVGEASGEWEQSMIMLNIEICTLSNLIFSRNQGKTGALFFFNYEPFLTTEVYANNIRVIENTSINGLICFVEINILIFQFSNSIVNSNTAESQGGFLRIYSTLESPRPYEINIDESIFKSNQARLGGVFFIGNLNSIQNFTNCLFIRNKAILGGVFLISAEKSTHVNSIDSGFEENEALNFGGVLLSLIGSFCDYRSYFKSNKASRGSVLLIGSSTKSNLTGSVIMNSYAEYIGTLVYVGITKSRIENCSIFYSRSKKYSSVLAVFNLATLQVLNSIFRENEAPTSTLLYTSFSNNEIVFENCLFFNNKVGLHSAFQINSAALKLKGCHFSGNVGSLIQASFSEVNINFSIFKNHSCGPLEGGCLINSLVKNTIRLDNSILFNISFKSETGCLSAASSNFYLTNLNITLLKGTNIDFLSASLGSLLYINNVTIQKYKNLGVSIRDSQSNWTGASFASQDIGGLSRGFLNINSNTTITSTDFKQHGMFGLFHQGDSGRISDIYLMKCNFSMNRGNGLIIFSSNNLLVDQCIFKDNKGDKGGGIYMTCSLNKCDWTIKNSFFLSNEAIVAGGAIYWENAVPRILDSNIFNENKANYGNDKATNPLKLELISDNNEGITNSLQNFRTGNVLNYSLNFAHKDFYNQTTNSIVTPMYIEIADFGSPQKSGFNGNPVNNLRALLGITSVISDEGKGSFSELKIIGQPETTKVLLISSNAINPAHIPKEVKENMNDPHKLIGGNYYYSILVKFTACEKGQIYNPIKNTCDVCPEGKYSLNVSETTCRDCPKNGKCPGGNAISLNKGFWRTSDDSDIIFTCHRSYSCDGGYESKCHEGFTGVLCDICQSNENEIYFMDIDFNCKSCDSDSRNKAYGVVTVITVVFIAYITYVVYTKMRDPAPEPSVLIKIFVDHLQIIGIVTNIDVKWPEEVKRFLHIQNSASNPEMILYPYDCSYQGLFDGLNIHFKRIIICFMLMFIIPIMIVIFWKIKVYTATKGRKLEEKQKEFQYKTMVSLIIVFYTLQPAFLNQFFSTFKCLQVENTSYITKYLNEECWSRNHIMIALGVNLPSLLILMFLVPIIIFRNIKRGLQSGSLGAEYSYMYQGYSQEFYYWDLVLMIQKYGIIIIVIFVNDSLLIMFFVNLISLAANFLQLTNRPYLYKTLNNIALLGKMVSHFTIFCTLCLIINPTLSVSITVLFFLFFLNTVFLFIWIMNYIGTYPKLRVHFTRILRILHIEYQITINEKIPVKGFEVNVVEQNPNAEFDEDNKVYKKYMNYFN